MSKTFATMQTNVGNMVQDTDASMATLIGVWLNDAYLDIARSCTWSALVDWNYTISVTSSAGSEYSLPADFDEELFVADITNGRPIYRYTEGKWWEEQNGAYSAGTIASGTPYRYLILQEAGKVHIDPPPDSNFTMAFPYKKSITALTTTGTTLIKDIESIMELKAIGEAWAYKRQFAKADYYLGRYEMEKAKRIGQERGKINQRYQMLTDQYRLDYPRPMTGWLSYNDL